MARAAAAGTPWRYVAEPLERRLLLSTTAPLLLSWLPGDGTAQRSVLKTYTLTFSEPVTLAPGAATVSQLTTNSSGTVTSSTDLGAAVGFSNPSGDGATWVLTPLAGGSLDNGHGAFRDGVYQVVLHPAQITDVAGSPLAPTIWGTAGSPQPLPAFGTEFGDLDGNGTVNALDYAHFKQAFGSSAGSAGFNAAFDFDGNGTLNALDYANFKRNFGKTYALPPTLFLAHDTGASPTDGITYDDTAAGTLPNAFGDTLKGGFDSTPSSSYADLTQYVQAGGSFTLTPAVLNQAYGGTVPDGKHTLHVLAFDANNNQVAALNLPFTLDTTAPAPPAVALAAGYASAPGQTTFAAPTLAGTAEPGAALSLGSSGTTSATADSAGNFTLPGVLLVPGANSVTVTASDVAGNTSTATVSLSRIAPQTANQVALDWDAQALSSIQLNASPAEVASRALAITSEAMYDAENSITGASSALSVRVATTAGASDVAAVAQAAHDALVYLFPAQQSALDARLATSLASVADPSARAAGVTVGQQVAAAIIGRRANDGATGYTDYTPGTGAGVWQPSFPAYMPAENPQWATLQPFMMASDSQFRPAGPTSLSSTQWQTDYNQVKGLGSASSTTRTADQTQIARFWNDPAGSSTPPGHWNMIATQLASSKNLSLADTTRMLAELNVAMGDAAIVAWDAKYTDNFWRPITAIAAGGGNAALSADATWRPLINTPPFPEYVSGHSTFSGAAAAVLDSVFGPNTSFSITSTSPGVSGVSRSFTGFDQAASEAAMSRVYAGIHFYTSVQDGMTAGTALGQYVVAKFAATSDTVAPAVAYTAAQNRPYNTNTAIAGTATDNLTGVKSLLGRFDSGPGFAVSFDPAGHFTVPTTFALDGSADGPHVLHVTATDYAGNTSAAYDYNFILDTKAPTIAVTSPALAAGQTGPLPIAAGATLAGTADGTGSSLVAMTYRFDNGTTVPVSAAADGSFSVTLDLSKLSAGTHTLTVSAADAAGNGTTTALSVSLAALAPLTVSSYTPTAGSGDIGATFRPEVFFSRPINPATLTAADFFLTDSTGTKVPTTIVPSDDGTYAWLFPTSAMPGASTMTVTVDGTQIKSADGALLDAASTGAAAGSKLTYSFTTVSTAALPGTSLSGVVADPGPDEKPATPDDVSAGPDNVLGTADDVYKLPIAGVTVSVVGTSLTTITNAQGAFSFSGVPSGDVKLEVDGTTATSAPSGFYFPQMVMDLNVLPGQANTVMADMQGTGTGNAPAGAAVTTAPGVYLPRVATSILTPVSQTGMTQIGVNAVSAPDLTPQQRSMLSITVPGGSAVGPDGKKMTNVQVGISTVPPSLVMDMLPAGLMQLSATITIQAPGVASFSTPLRLSFPNLYNAAPGAKLNFYSYDHTTGRLVIEGTATVSADGLSVTTDPGTGITHPGWHGLTPIGALLNWATSIWQGCREPNCDCTGIALSLGGLALSGVGAAATAPEDLAAVGAAGLGVSLASLLHDVSVGSVKGLIVDTLGAVFGDIESISTAGGLAKLARDSGWLTADGRTRFFRNVSTWLNKFPKGMESALGVFGAFLNIKGLREQLNKCSGQSIATAALDGLIAALDRGSGGVFNALDSLVGDLLAPLLPTDRGVVPVASGNNITALELDGTPYIDPSTGKPFSVPISSVISPLWYTDPQFRQGIT